MKKENNAASDDVINIGNFTEEMEKNSAAQETKKLREKFITSEEDDTLSENWIEDQEEQNEIHNDFSNDRLKEKSE